MSTAERQSRASKKSSASGGAQVIQFHLRDRCHDPQYPERHQIALELVTARERARQALVHDELDQAEREIEKALDSLERLFDLNSLSDQTARGLAQIMALGTELNELDGMIKRAREAVALAPSPRRTRRRLPANVIDLAAARARRAAQ